MRPEIQSYILTTNDYRQGENQLPTYTKRCRYSRSSACSEGHAEVQINGISDPGL